MSTRGIVVFGDVVRSRAWPKPTADWLERLCRELDAEYADERLAGFEFTQGDEIQGLLRTNADPFRAVLSATLRPRTEVPEMRWAIVAGEVEEGRGPATRRTGPAFITARETINLARHDRDTVLVRSGDAEADGLLEGTAPVLGSLLVRLTDRQREVARLAILDGLRGSEVADRLGIKRSTVSVAFARADVRSLERLLNTTRTIWSQAMAAAE
ncbi:MAG: SatD family protein [Candidatus Limnocylindrales bacterium]